MKNSADQGGCYPQRPKAEVDNTLRDLQNSSYPTKAGFNNCFKVNTRVQFVHTRFQAFSDLVALVCVKIIVLLFIRNISPFLKEFHQFALFFPSPKITQPCLQGFSVNGSIICDGLYF